VERTHLYKHDLDWLPRSFKIVRWTAAGGIWAVTGALVGAIGVASHSGGFIGAVGKPLVLAGLYAGDRSARALLRRRLSKLAHGQVELARLKQEADGELVHVRGRVHARALVNGLVDDGARGVFRRVHASFGQVRVVHEAAIDFALVDEHGESIIVEVEGARLIAPEPKLARVDGLAQAVDRLLALPLPKEIDRWRAKRNKRLAKRKKPERIAASEYLLRDGDEVEVVGYKNRRVDVSVGERLERDTPLRATLRAGRELPLILSPAR